MFAPFSLWVHRFEAREPCDVLRRGASTPACQRIARLTVRPSCHPPSPYWRSALFALAIRTKRSKVRRAQVSVELEHSRRTCAALFAGIDVAKIPPKFSGVDVARSTTAAPDVHMRELAGDIRCHQPEFHRIALLKMAELTECDLVHFGGVGARPSEPLHQRRVFERRNVLDGMNAVDRVEGRRSAGGGIGCHDGSQYHRNLLPTEAVEGLRATVPARERRTGLRLRVLRPKRGRSAARRLASSRPSAVGDEPPGVPRVTSPTDRSFAASAISAPLPPRGPSRSPHGMAAHPAES